MDRTSLLQTADSAPLVFRQALQIFFAEAALPNERTEDGRRNRMPELRTVREEKRGARHDLCYTILYSTGRSDIYETWADCWRTRSST